MSNFVCSLDGPPTHQLQTPFAHWDTMFTTKLRLHTHTRTFTHICHHHPIDSFGLREEITKHCQIEESVQICNITKQNMKCAVWNIHILNSSTKNHAEAKHVCQDETTTPIISAPIFPSSHSLNCTALDSTPIWSHTTWILCMPMLLSNVAHLPLG